MPKYETPEPISVTIELGVGNVRIAAGDRTDTTVEVRPTDEDDESDVKAAQQIRTDYTNGTLQVTGPKVRAFDFSKKSRSVDITIELPTGSALAAHLQMGDAHCAGQLGECQLKTTGNIWFERTGPLRVHTGAGHITADSVDGDADASTGSGTIRLGTVGGTVAVKNSNGDIAVTAVTGDARLRTANGDISLDRAGADVDAKTSNGSIRLGEVARGSVALGTAFGDLDIGIADGTAARLEVNTGHGHVRNLMETAAGPGEADETVEIRGRTSYGDITIHRS